MLVTQMTCSCGAILDVAHNPDSVTCGCGRIFRRGPAPAPASRGAFGQQAERRPTARTQGRTETPRPRAERGLPLGEREEGTPLPRSSAPRSGTPLARAAFRSALRVQTPAGQGFGLSVVLMTFGGMVTLSGLYAFYVMTQLPPMLELQAMVSAVGMAAVVAALGFVCAAVFVKDLGQVLMHTQALIQDGEGTLDGFAARRSPVSNDRLVSSAKTLSILGHVLGGLFIALALLQFVSQPGLAALISAGGTVLAGVFSILAGRFVRWLGERTADQSQRLFTLVTRLERERT